MGKYSVYCHTTPSGKRYIGITGQYIKKRWQNGYGYISNPHFYNAIQKYGWENIKHEILFDGLTKNEAENKEIEFINLYKTNEKAYGYNIQNGGNTIGMHAESSIKKMSEVKRGKINSIETRQKISKGNKGKIISAETRKKISIYQTGIKRSEETKRKMGENHNYPIGKNHLQSKAILQFDKKGALIKRWDCTGDVEREVGYARSHICACCNGKRKTANGYRWEYENSEKDA